MSAKEISGYFAVVFTIGMKLPQLYHTIRTKRTKDLSMGFLITEIFGHFSWLSYGILDNNLPLIITDSICLVLSFILIGLKIYYDKKIKVQETNSIEN